MTARRTLAAALLLALGLVALVAPQPARAVTETWIGAGMATSMNNPAYWLDGTTPVSGDSNLTLVFNSGFTNNLNQDIPSPPLEIQSLQLNGTNLFMSGGQLRLKNLGAAPSIELNNSNGLTTLMPIDFANATTFKSTGTSFSNSQFSGALTGGPVTFDGQSTSPMQVFVNGGGTLLTGANLITGLTNIYWNGGSGSLSGTMTVSGLGASLRANGSSNIFTAGTDFTAQNSGNFDLQGYNQTLDQVILESGGNIIASSGETLTITGPIKSSTGHGAIGQFVTNALVDFSGQFKNVDVTSTGAGDLLIIRNRIVNGSIDKTGPGVLVIPNGNNTFTGTNVVNGGTLQGSPQSIGTVTNNATVNLDTFGTLAAGQITGPGQVVLSSSITYGGAQGYAGGTFLAGGSAIGDTSTLLGSFTGTLGGNVTFNQNANATWSGTLSGTASLSKNGTGVLSLAGSNPYSLGTFVGQGTLEVQSDTAIGSGPLFVFSSSISAVGARTFANPLTLYDMSFTGTGNFDFTDTALKQPSIAVNHNSTGTTKIAGVWQNGGTALTVNAGALQIGDPTVVNGFTSSGPVVVNGGTLTLRSLNFITLPTVTLAGGTLNVPNGYAIPLGSVLQGNGGVTGRVASANGSTIIAAGNMTIGDGNHVAGVNLDGELYTGANTVTLADSNQAVLGSYTLLGDGTNQGNLVAPKGLIVNFGRNLAGFGQVVSNNTLANAVIMNGDVQGDSFTNYLEFTGYVKGVGTFNNVAFSGTFSPGLSPALVHVGSAALLPTSVLEMELGGSLRGGQYDALDVAGTLALGGELKLSLLDGFVPHAGDSWQLFSGALAGAFTGYDLPALAPGLSWDLSHLASTGVASVVAGLVADFNASGRVAGDDFLSWQRGGHGAGDLVNWKVGFGGGNAPNIGAVPEPSTIILALAAAACCIRRRR